MRRNTSAALILLLLAQLCLAQTPAPNASQPARATDAKIPDGTPVEIALAHTLNSAEVKAGDIISLRVLKPVRVEGVTVIAEGALATGRVLKAKRGRPFGKAGQLAWEIQEVVAANGQTVPLAFVERRKGESKSGTVATAAAITVVLFPVAPVALLWGFKRGKSAVVPAGTIFTAVTRGDATIATPATR
ncbi:MAG TPA: hypothetical protein VJT82_07285 [Pyrinomonadaceae bacterium]|nr:hypothetical protein [Pyrinomonadaceae bacterium]